MNIKFLLITLIVFALSCTENKKGSLVDTAESKPLDLANEAYRLSHQFIIVDGHVDLPY